MAMPLPALVLTAGYGTRLRPLSAVRAKPAVPVAGEPLVRRILRRLSTSGVVRVVLNLHHLPETICRVVGDGSDLGLDVRYSWENPILGSAGGPRRALPLLSSDRFLIVNGDTLSDLALGPLVDEHVRSNALITMAVVPNAAPRQYGGVLVEEDGSVTGFVGRNSPHPSWHFIGLQVAESRAFVDLPADRPAETVGMLYPALIQSRPGSVRAFRCHASFDDVGTTADYLATTMAYARREGRTSVVAGPGCRVAASASLERTILWDDVIIGDRVRLFECVVTDGVCIPAGVELTRRAVVRAGTCAVGPSDEAGDGLVAVPIGGAAAHPSTVLPRSEDGAVQSRSPFPGARKR